ncbi:MAG: Rieske 2Fe-2S domain-containing protein [Alphaproteobacteria bacterium]
MSAQERNNPGAKSGDAKSDRLQASRRTVVAGLVAGVGVAAARPALAQDGAPQVGDRLQIFRGPAKNQYLRPELMKLNDKPLTVFPIIGGDGAMKDDDRLNRMLALRLDPDEMDEDTRAMTAEGVLLYSALCTHQACVIASWKKRDRHLRCHCHLSEFDALAMGAVRKGPARRPLAVVPVRIDEEGFVRLAGEFNRTPGARG